MAKFCTNCGAPCTEDMVKCSQCGKVLRKTPIQSGMSETEGQAIMQEKVRTAIVGEQEKEGNAQETGIPGPDMEQYHEQISQVKEKSFNYAARLFYYISNIIKNPKSFGEKMLDEQDVSICGGIIVGQAVLSAIFAILYAGKLKNKIKTLGDFLYDMASDLVDQFGGGSVDDPVSALSGYIDSSRIFICTLAGSLVLSVVMAALILAAHKVIKNYCNYKMALGVVAMRSAMMIPVILFAMLISVINWKFGIVLFCFSSIFGFCYMSVGFHLLAEGKNDWEALAVAVVIILFFVVACFVIPKIGSYILPENIRNLSLKDFLSNLE